MPVFNHRKHIAGFLILVSFIITFILLNQQIVNLFFPNPLLVLSQKLQNPTITSEEKVVLINSFTEKADTDTQLSVSVSNNKINELTKQLKNKELSLKEKERLINDKELGLARANKPVMALGGGLFVLFVLVILNFYLDYRHFKKNSPQ